MSRDMVCANTSSSARIPCRVVNPGARSPLICAARYSLNRVVNSGPLTGLIETSVESGTDSPLALRRSEEHTSELQSLTNLVCRLLLDKKKQNSRRCHWRNRKGRRKDVRRYLKASKYTRRCCA